MAKINAINNSSAPFTVPSGTLTITAGKIGITAGTLSIAVTKYIIIGNTRLHTGSSTSSVYYGYSCGPFGASNALGNVGIGGNCMGALTDGGNYNLGLGRFALGRITTADNNVGCGAYAGAQSGSVGLHTGIDNTFLGYQAGYNLSISEHSNILFNNTGSNGIAHRVVLGLANGTTAQKLGAAYISGIYDKTVGSTASVLCVDSNSGFQALAGAADKALMGGTKPAFSTASYFATSTQGNLAYAGSTNIIGGITKNTGATRYLSNTGTNNNPAWAQVVLTDGVSGVLPPANGGILPNTDITASPQAITANNGYISNLNSLITFTLPSTAAQGTLIRIVGKGTGTWKLEQNAGQSVKMGNSTTATGTGGNITSSDQWASATLACITEDTDWVITEYQGSLTLA